MESRETGNIGSVNNNIINLVRAEINTLLLWQNIRVTVNVWFLVQIYLRRVKHLNCWYQNVNIHYIKFSKVILQVWITYSMNTENLTSINWLSFWGKQYQMHFSSTRKKCRISKTNKSSKLNVSHLIILNIFDLPEDKSQMRISSSMNIWKLISIDWKFVRN